MSVLESLAGRASGVYADLPLCIPDSPEEIEGIQRRRKRIAVERARRSAFWRPRLAGIDTGKLDDPAEWSKIPILTKDELRAMTTERFYEDFCTIGGQPVCEYWRSGGSTGKPLFYPKTFEDILFNMVGFTRTFASAGIRGGQNHRTHVSTPLGVHPVGHMWARAAQIMGIGAVWAGSGASLPSVQQLALIASLRPTVWMGMSSYGLHLANRANAEGIDLAGGSVSTMLCSAEALSAAKREKLERDWGATVYDCFGMTEISMLAAEGPSREGFRIWTDLAIVEVLDPDTGKPVADGEPGHLVCTALFGNNGAPFLRWESGDIVVMNPAEGEDGAFSVFPTMRHAHRTAGFFKLRGVNVNHQEFEDMMFAHRAVNDFKLELTGDAAGLESLRVSVEPRRGADTETLREELARQTKDTFELSPHIVILEPGVLAREFETSVKAPRFIDLRE